MAKRSSSSSKVDDGADVGGYEYEEEFIENARGMKLFTCRWLPKAQPVKALVFICHGYAVECSVTMRGTGTRLARAGYAVHGVDYEGHGRSDGLRGYVPSFDVLLADCDAHFTSVAAAAQPPLPRFLLGESMGGAVALLLHRARPAYWAGAVLVAPMCKIADEMKPHPAVIKVLEAVVRFIPTWKVVPTRNVIGAAYRTQAKRDEIRRNPYCYKGRPRLRTARRVRLHLVGDLAHGRHQHGAGPVGRPRAVQEQRHRARNVIGAAYRTQAKRDEIRRNPYCYKGRPRLRTAHELLRASLRVESEVLTRVTLPFLVVHGGGDRVTDPEVSRLLCREAPSTDKTLKLYPGMWHALTSGESPENIDLVFADIIAWLDHRSTPPREG